MTTSGDATAGIGSPGDGHLLERAAELTVAQAPSGWTRLLADFEPTSRDPRAYVTSADGINRQLRVPADALALVEEHRHRAAAAGSPWHRLTLDYGPDGRASVRVERPTPTARKQIRKWSTWTLAAVTVGCVLAAAVVVATGWRWTDLPEAAVAAPAGPSADERAALEVIQGFFDAKNRGDVAAMRAAACPNPAGGVINDIGSVEQNNLQEITVVDAIVGLTNDGAGVTASVVMRYRGLDQRMKQIVEDAQQSDLGGGLFFSDIALVDDGSGLKVCGR